MSKSKDIKKDYSGSIFIRDETQKYKKVSNIKLSVASKVSKVSEYLKVSNSIKYYEKITKSIQKL